jgi:uncharacterized membrane protein
MSDQMDFIAYYFTEEKIISIFIIAIGLISVILACIFLSVIKYSFFKGMAIPLLIIGIMQLIQGYTIHECTTKDNARVEHLKQFERQKITSEELPRMQKVMSNFTMHKLIEICLVLLGLLLYIIYYKSAQSFWKGFGLALLIQALILLSVDLINEKRGREYAENLTTL